MLVQAVDKSAAVKLARIPDHQQLAERVAEATSAEWEAELPTDTSRAQPQKMHPMHAVTALAQGATDAVDKVDVSNMNKQGRNPGFYLIVREPGKAQVKKQKAGTNKHNFFEVLQATARDTGVSEDVKNVLLGLRAAIRAVLPVHLQPKLDACCDKCRRKHCPLCMGLLNG
jgi:hypothetical protein